MRTDFTKCPLSNIYYGGSDKKIGIVFQNDNWMLKFRKMTAYGEAFNDISEYVGSMIFSILGFETQEVLLGTYKGKNVVACKDFMFNKKYTPFDDVGESSIDDDKYKYTYSYEDIEKLINRNKKINSKDNALDLFWRTYVVDCLLANNDRHGKNWGFIKLDNQYYPAPIFDNGNCLFSSFGDEEEMDYMLNNEEELLEKVYEYPRSIIKNTEGLNDYYSVIYSKKYQRCNSAVIFMVPIIKNKMREIMQVIDDVDCSDIKKSFMKTIIKKRFELILLKTYGELLNEND